MLSQIRAMQGKFSKSELRVADIILDNPENFVEATLQDLAQATGVSEPTIIRFCRSLKLTGFREFRTRLAQDLASRIQYQHSQIDAKDSGGMLVNKIVDSAISSLTDIRHQLDEETVNSAISSIAGSHRIEIYGVGGAGIVVQDAHLKFARLGLNSQPFTDAYLQQVSAGMLAEGSCVLAISNSGRSKDLLASVRLAREAGATNHLDYGQSFSASVDESLSPGHRSRSQR